MTENPRRGSSQRRQTVATPQRDWLGSLAHALAAEHTGLSVGERVVRIVHVRATRVLYSREAEYDSQGELPRTIRTVLAELDRWRRGTSTSWPAVPRLARRVTVAMEPAFSHLKRIGGLPRVSDRRVLAGIVRQARTRYFVAGGAVIVGGAVNAPDGQLWVSACDEDITAAVREACRAARWRVVDVLPAAALLPSVLTGGPLVWRESRWELELVHEAGEMLSIRRRRSPAASEVGDIVAVAAESIPVPALAALGPGAARFAPAYGAAMTRAPHPLGLATTFDGARRVPTWRIVAPVVVGIVALALSALVPPLLSAVAARGALARLGDRALEREQAAHVLAEWSTASAPLEQVWDFARDRRSMTSLLAALTRAVPPSAAILSLRIDSAGGTMVLLGEAAAASLVALETIPEIASAELVGPVTREPSRVPVMNAVSLAGTTMPGVPEAGGRELERATVRFTHAPAPLPSGTRVPSGSSDD